MQRTIVRPPQPLKRGPSNKARRLNVKLFLQAGKSLEDAREQAAAMQFNSSRNRRQRAINRNSKSKRFLLRHRLPYWTVETPHIVQAPAKLVQTTLDSRTCTIENLPVGAS